MSECDPALAARAMAFREIEIGPWRVVITEQLADSFEALARSIDFAEKRDALSLGIPIGGVSGRGQNALIDLPGSVSRLHLRPLRHGGVLAPITGNRFAGLERPLAELRLCAKLMERGAPIAVPALVVGRRTGLFWQAAFATVHIEDAVDGVAYLDSKPDAASLTRTASAAGSSIRRLHDLGCCHADLHVKNLLIRETSGAVEVTIIDLDRARLEDNVGDSRRMLELTRLHRSLIKRGYASALAPDVTRAFTDAYVDGDIDLRDHLLARGKAERLRGRAHAMFYRSSQ